MKLCTVLRPFQVPGNCDTWYHVQIFSYDGRLSVTRCEAHVCPSSKPEDEVANVPHLNNRLERQVAKAYWYDVLESHGLKYGSIYQGLDEISTGVTEHRVTAAASTAGDESNYNLHPVAIDQCLQTTLIAACKGQGRLLEDTLLVRTIENLLISGCGPSRLQVEANAEKDASSAVLCNVSATSEQGLPRFLLRNCRVLPVQTNDLLSKRKLLSFLKWDTDAQHEDLNNMLNLSVSKPDWSSIKRALELLAHKNPRLRVLELGYGDTVVTEFVLKTLNSKFGERSYSSYTYAAFTLDAAFKAKAAYGRPCDVDLTFFDLEHQTQSQSLQPAAYDLLIITHVRC